MTNYNPPAVAPGLNQSTLAVLVALTLALGCENAAILDSLPGTTWQLSDTTLSTFSFHQIEVPSASNGSSTLYAGPIGGDMTRESVILLRPALLDSFIIADSNFISAELLLFRRTFRDSNPDPTALFELSIIVADTIVWSESDTGLTADSPAFEVLAGAVDTSMITASLAFPAADAVEFSPGLEYLRLPILAETFNDWLSDSTANNGFMLRQINGARPMPFYPRSSARPPLIAVTYEDTSNGGEVKTIFSTLVANLGVYPPSEESMPPDDNSLMVLKFDAGWGVYVDFSPSLIPDSSRRIIAATMNFFSPQLPEDLTASTVTLRLERRLFADSLNVTTVLFPAVEYSVDAAAWTVYIGSFASGINNRAVENFGLELSIVPLNHDFETLIFHSPYAESALRPTLELVYGRAYQEEQ